jgi:hypothetical protein
MSYRDSQSWRVAALHSWTNYPNKRCTGLLFWDLHVAPRLTARGVGATDACTLHLEALSAPGAFSLYIPTDTGDVVYDSDVEQGHNQRGGFGGAVGLQPPETTQNQNSKNTDSVHTAISEVLRDVPFSRNQPLKSADDCTLEFWKIN